MPDAVVIGAGPNGLVAANLLADAGWSVEVLEEQREPGGAVRHDRGDPEFVSDLFSSFYPPAAASPVLRGLRLEETGSALTAHTFLPDLIGTAGYYLQIASLAAFGAAPMMSAYCASKAGAEAFAHALRAEVAHHGVAVGIAYLNWTATDMIREADHHAVLRELRAHTPTPVRHLHAADFVAHRLAQAVENRRTAVYTPAWLRLAHLSRTALPPLVLRRSRYLLSRLQAEQPFHRFKEYIEPRGGETGAWRGRIRPGNPGSTL